MSKHQLRLNTKTMPTDAKRTFYFLPWSIDTWDSLNWRKAHKISFNPNINVFLGELKLCFIELYKNEVWPVALTSYFSGDVSACTPYLLMARCSKDSNYWNILHFQVEAAMRLTRVMVASNGLDYSTQKCLALQQYSTVLRYEAAAKYFTWSDTTRGHCTKRVERIESRSILFIYWWNPKPRYTSRICYGLKQRCSCYTCRCQPLSKSILF